MTGAIEFLQHARALYKAICDGNEQASKLKAEAETFNELIYMTDEELADLVREVERWWRENGENK